MSNTCDNDSYGSVDRRLREGDFDASRQVFARYANRLCELARSRIDLQMKSKFDPDDVVQSVFRSFFRRHKNGDFQLDDWQSLWALLATIAVRKCARRRVRYKRDKRSVTREAAAEHEMASSEPSPDEVVALKELVLELMSSLEPKHRELMTLKLQGYTNEEVSEKLGCSERTVYRVLKGVRSSLGKAEAEIKAV